MKELQSRLWAKITALLLLSVFAVMLALGAFGILVLLNDGGYSAPEKFLSARAAGNTFWNDMQAAADYYTFVLRKEAGEDITNGTLEHYENLFSEENSNFFFTITDPDGKLLFEGPYQSDDYQYTYTSAPRYLSYNWRDVTETHVEFASQEAFEAYLDALEDENFTIYEATLETADGKRVSTYRDNSSDVEYAIEESDFVATEAEEPEADTFFGSAVFGAAPAETAVAVEAASEDDLPSAGRETSHRNEAEPLYGTIFYQCFDYVRVNITGFIKSELTARDGIYEEVYFLNLLLENRYVLIAVVVGLFILCLALFVFLLCAAGHKEGVEGIYLNWVDKLPLDLYLLAALCAGCIILAFFFELVSTVSAAWLILPSLLLILFVLLVMNALMTFAARAKAGTLWKNTIIYRAFALCLRGLRAILRGLQYMAGNLHLYWQAGLLWCAICAAQFLGLILFANDGAAALLWFFIKLPETVLLIFVVIALQKLKAGGEALAAGDLESKVDLSRMYGVLRRHGENLNSIAEGMQKAVQQKMKSERFRTDLITNVSHDIKTPLTSIVNYVDLLKKEDIQPEKAKEYLAVLDRQSARLKKLTEDLVEASKASSGVIPVHFEAVDVNVLLSQVSAEYQGRLELGRLESVIKLSAEQPQILADGKLLWRVFDNLLSNICKYAMPGTRVYFTSEVEGGMVTISFKNISNYPLDITADELMERFVRGDGSRSTEGSGLGLSIAQSLTGLQKGTFALVVDGDLFKANICFPLLKI